MCLQTNKTTCLLGTGQNLHIFGTVYFNNVKAHVNNSLSHQHLPTPSHKATSVSFCLGGWFLMDNRQTAPPALVQLERSVPKSQGACGDKKVRQGTPKLHMAPNWSRVNRADRIGRESTEPTSKPTTWCVTDNLSTHQLAWNNGAAVIQSNNLE